MINEKELKRILQNRIGKMSVAERRAYLKKMGFDFQELSEPAVRSVNRRSVMATQSSRCKNKRVRVG